MARKKELKSTLQEFHVRNDSVERQERWAQVQRMHNGLTKNALLLKCLDIGISALLDESKPLNIELQSLISESEKHLENIIKTESKKIIDNTKTLSIMLKISEQIQSTVMQSLDFFIKTQGVDIPAAALEQFRKQLPAVFEKQKADYINKLFN